MIDLAQLWHYGLRDTYSVVFVQREVTDVVL